MKKTIPREVEDRDIGWFAGILDGEGSITLTKPRKESNEEVESYLSYTPVETK